MLVAGVKPARQSVQPVLTGTVEPDNGHGFASVLELLRNRVKGRDRGGIPDLRLSEINSDMTGRIGVIKAINQVIA